MKVKVLKTGEIKEAKRFKDVTKEEIACSCGKDLSIWDDNCIFTEPAKNIIGWTYVYDKEVEIIEEESNV